MTIVLQSLIAHPPLCMFYKNSLQSHTRLQSDLNRAWNRILLLVFAISMGAFVLWMASFALDIQVVILAFLFIHSLYALNLYIIVHDGNKSLQWMTIGDQVSDRIILQEMLYVQKEALANLVYFSLIGGVSAAAFVYHMCEHTFFAIIWIPIVCVSAYQVVVSCADISWARTAYTYWGEQIPPKL